MALGDYSKALADLEKARWLFPKVREEGTDRDALAQSTLALYYHQQGENEIACEHARRALNIHRSVGHPYRQAFALSRIGHALADLGSFEEADDAYRQALALFREMGQRHLAPEPLAGLARVALAGDDPAAALAYVEEILNHLDTGSPSTSSGCNFDGTDEPLRIYLTCYLALRANDDPRAGDVLETAHRLLQERAAKIEDEALRRSYLENVRAHRELVREFERSDR
jgi:tetratricopeptide (TPR) repeat protein